MDLEKIFDEKTIAEKDLVRGKRLLEMGVKIEAAVLAARPLVMMLVVVASMCATAFGQSPPTGGGIFGSSSDTLGQALRAVVYLARGLAFFGGIIYIIKGCWAAAKHEQNYGHQLFWGGVMLVVGTVISVIYTLARGQMVNLNYDLSGN